MELIFNKNEKNENYTLTHMNKFKYIKYNNINNDGTQSLIFHTIYINHSCYYFYY